MRSRCQEHRRGGEEHGGGGGSPLKESFTDLRRGKLTLVDVLRAAPPWRGLRLQPVLLASLFTAIHLCYVLPAITSFSSRRWQESVEAGLVEARPGGPFSEVSLAYAVLLSLAYVGLTFVGANRMAQRPAPSGDFVFECVAVHNVTQCCLNLYCFLMLAREGQSLGLQIWGNEIDTSDRTFALGRLMWLQYHSRQLSLVETGFMVVQKKFRGVSVLHVYLRVLNLWGWYIACRFVCGGEAFVPALASAACQTVVYGLYSSFSLAPCFHTSRAGWVFQVQIAQYVLCAIHSVAASAFGNFPKSLAALHLFVITNGLVLYTEWFSESASSSTPKAGASARDGFAANSADGAARRVTFSFDSCGWLMVYHFGVAAWLSEHLGLERSPGKGQLRKDVGFSGSSGGALVACVLGAGTCVRDVFDFVLEQQPACRRNPRGMFTAVENALRKFQYDGAYSILTGRIRVLLTRITWLPPFVQGEVVDKFPDNETAVEVLCASCHVPMFAGIMPRRVFGRYYYDGLVWPSWLLVPWRGAPGDHVVRVSAAASPLADIRISSAPFWWAVIPPDPKVLRGIFWCGYRDAAKWFGTQPVLPDTCASRRENGNRANAELDEEGTLARWRAAQALRTSTGQELPKADPVTGEEVLDLIRLADSEIQRASQLLSRALTVAVAFTAAACAALVPSFLPF